MNNLIQLKTQSIEIYNKIAYIEDNNQELINKNRSLFIQLYKLKYDLDLIIKSLNSRINSKRPSNCFTNRVIH